MVGPEQVQISSSLFEHEKYPATFPEDATDEQLAEFIRQTRSAYDSAVTALEGVCEALENVGMTKCS